MRSIESEVIGEDELADGRIEWQLPAPARLRVRFDFPGAGDHPRYDFSSIQIASHIPDVAKYYTVWLQKQYDNLSFDATLDDLPPNDYLLLAKVKGRHHHIIVHVRDNPVIEHGARMFGAKSMVCKWFMGVYAAHGEMELGVGHVRLKENKCIRLGAPYCEWETKW